MLPEDRPKILFDEAPVRYSGQHGLSQLAAHQRLLRVVGWVVVPVVHVGLDQIGPFLLAGIRAQWWKLNNVNSSTSERVGTAFAILGRSCLSMIYTLLDRHKE